MINLICNYLKNLFSQLIVRIRNKPKVFVIGLNKTGTTSMARVFKDFDFIVDNQDNAHKLIYFYEKRDFKSIVKYCYKSEVFQDAPFSMRHTFHALYNTFPNAKFILTMRDSPEQWYFSLLNFHIKKYSSTLEAPSKQDLELAKRPFGRSVYKNIKLRLNTPDNDLYNKESLLNYYTEYNNEVMDFFRVIPKNFLVLNLKEPKAYQKLCRFLNLHPLYENFPWENKT